VDSKTGKPIEPIIKIIPATVVQFEKYIWKNYLLGDFVEALKAADVIFIDVLVESGAERDVTPNARNPFINATFNLKVTYLRKQRRKQKTRPLPLQVQGPLLRL
jgi:hypothetical protein